MGATDRSAAVAVFADRSQAENAVAELLQRGFRPEQIGFALVADSSAEAQSFTRAHTQVARGAEAGIAIGGLAGAAIAGVVLPVAGIVVAGGVLTALLTGAAGGGMLGALIGLSIPEEEARVHERNFHSGHTVVTVHDEQRYEEAMAIMASVQESEAKAPHHGRGRLAELSESYTDNSGAGRTFVPEP